MLNAERIADAVVAELKTTDNRDPRAWAALKKRLARVIDAQLVAPPAENGPVRLFTTHEVAALLQVDASTIAKWIDSGKLVAFRTPGSHRRVKESDFKAFCEKFQIPVTGALAA